MVFEDRHDWLLQQIDDMCEMVAKATLQSVGVQVDVEKDEVDEAQIDGLLEEHFFHSRLDPLDVRAAKLILRNDQVELYCKLLEAKSKLREAEGDELGARRFRSRAEALRKLANND